MTTYDAVKDAEATDIPLSSVSIGGRLHSATYCSFPTTSICMEAPKKNSNNSVKDWRKLLLEISFDKRKMLINIIKPRPSTNVDEWENAGRSERVQIAGITTNQRRNIKTMK